MTSAWLRGRKAPTPGTPASARAAAPRAGIPRPRLLGRHSPTASIHTCGGHRSRLPGAPHGALARSAGAAHPRADAPCGRARRSSPATQPGHGWNGPRAHPARPGERSTWLNGTNMSWTFGAARPRSYPPLSRTCCMRDRWPGTRQVLSRGVSRIESNPGSSSTPMSVRIA